MCLCYVMWCVLFFKQKTAYEMRISDWSSDVCSSDLDDRREGHDRDRGREPSSSVNINIEFHDNDRMAVRDYYADLGHRGRCPPGLAKKHDRCMPPGQAKRWEIGRPLPRDEIGRAHV